MRHEHSLRFQSMLCISRMKLLPKSRFFPKGLGGRLMCTLQLAERDQISLQVQRKSPGSCRNRRTFWFMNHKGAASASVNESIHTARAAVGIWRVPPTAAHSCFNVSLILPEYAAEMHQSLKHKLSQKGKPTQKSY